MVERTWRLMETAPRDGTIVDVWLGNAEKDEVEFYCTPGSRRACDWKWQQGKFRPATGLMVLVVTVVPTHWMPIPQGPKR
jgi:hypothetical protein